MRFGVCKHFKLTVLHSKYGKLGKTMSIQAFKFKQLYSQSKIMQSENEK